MNLGTLLGRKGTLLWTNKEVHVALNEGKIIQAVVRFIYPPLEVVARTIACCLHTFLEGGQDNLFCRESTRGNPFGFSFKICLKHEVSQCSIYRRAIGRPKLLHAQSLAVWLKRHTFLQGGQDNLSCRESDL